MRLTDREKLLRKIRALLAKTVATGCPVEEALAAHAKAQALIDEYQVGHEELYGTGPGRRWRLAEPEPAEPQQPKPDPHYNPYRTHRSAGAAVFCIAIASLILLIGWERAIPTGWWLPSQPPPARPVAHTEPIMNPPPAMGVEDELGDSLQLLRGGRIYTNGQTYTIFRIWDTGSVHHILSQAPTGEMRLSKLSFDASGKATRGIICDFDRSGWSECVDRSGMVSHLPRALIAALYSYKQPYPDHSDPPPMRDRFVPEDHQCVKSRVGEPCCPPDDARDWQNQMCRLEGSLRPSP
jgi:hypothetical protein